jgi:hypothetical protein
MVATVHADISPLLEAVGAADEARVIGATIELLGRHQVPPAHVAARVAIPAAWAGGDGHPLLVLGAAGRVAEWMRAIPAGPEPGDDESRRLAPALPLVQGFVAVGERVREGLKEPHPALPEPLMPFDITTEGGALGTARAAFAAGDRALFGRVLMGLYRTGADYRAIQTLVYAVLDHRAPEGGHPLLFAVGSARVLDMAEWGDRVPPLVHWLVPLLFAAEPDAPAAQRAREFAAAPGHELGWLRTRLAVAKEEAAGATFRRAVLAGDATAACEAVLGALRAGASARGVASGLALAAAERLLTVAEGAGEQLVQAGHALHYAHTVHTAMRQTQDEVVFPLLYTAAAVVNAMPRPATAGAVAGPSAPLSGGLIAPALLRSLERQVADGETAGALATARRYVQMGQQPRGLAGVLGAAASRRDPRRGGLHTLPLVAAALEEYLTQPGATPTGFAAPGAGQSALLAAAIRLASELPGDTALATRVAAAIDAAVGGRAGA